MRGKGRLDYVAFGMDPATKKECLWAFSDQGKVLWRVPGSKWWGRGNPFKVADFNHDGKEDVVAVPDEHLQIYDERRAKYWQMHRFLRRDL